MFRPVFPALAPFIGFLAFGLWGSSSVAETTRPYAGQQERAIAALSPDEMEGLRMGAGLGYAKPAELNGWPGPLHVLELAEELGLSPETRLKVAEIRDGMWARTRELGAALIEAEARLDALFAEGRPTPEAIAAATQEAGAIEARLRAAHLEAHLSTTALLTRHQRMLYAQARGYGTAGHGTDGDAQGHRHH